MYKSDIDVQEFKQHHEDKSFYFPNRKLEASHPLLIIPNFLTPDEVQMFIRQMISNLKYAELMTGMNEAGERVYRPDYRSTGVIRHVDVSLLNKKFEYIVDLIKNYWDADYEFGMSSTWAPMVYAPGDHYKLHPDNMMPSPPYKILLPKYVFSCIIYLNDISREASQTDLTFTGGELIFPQWEEDGKPLIIPPKAGTLVLFPSNAHYQHQVNPVKEGIRLCIANWFGRADDMRSFNP